MNKEKTYICTLIEYTSNSDCPPKVLFKDSEQLNIWDGYVQHYTYTSDSKTTYQLRGEQNGK
jgi:hypothetical protein